MLAVKVKLKKLKHPSGDDSYSQMFPTYLTLSSHIVPNKPVLFYQELTAILYVKKSFGMLAVKAEHLVTLHT